MNFIKRWIADWLPHLNRQVWILAGGRLLSQLGTGFTLFYAPIFFTQVVGFSRTAVGIGLGSASVSGIIGRFLAGTMTDSQVWGRKRTLLLSAAISALADVVLALAHHYPSFVLGNLLMGFGIGLYWPAAETAVVDLTNAEQRNEAFGLSRLSDSLGLSLGVMLGGGWIAATLNYRMLFAIDGVSFVVFLGVVAIAISETRQADEPSETFRQGWGAILRDRSLLMFIPANILFTTYISQVQSTLPLYFSDFVPVGNAIGLPPTTISWLFAGHITLTAISQLPIARRLNAWSRVQALRLSAVLWGAGFLAMGAAGVAPIANRLWAGSALAVLAFATVTYLPSASTLVADLAPDHRRGVYLAVHSQCWAIGYFIGPPLGGIALDSPRPWADGFWLIAALSTAIALGLLHLLNRHLARTQPSPSDA